MSAGESFREKYGWEFLFLGANMDAVSEAGRIGICTYRSARFHNDGEGIRNNYKTIEYAMTALRETGGLEDSILDRVKEDYQKRVRR